MKLDWLNKATGYLANLPDINLVSWPGSKPTKANKEHFGNKVQNNSPFNQWGDVSTVINNVADTLARNCRGYKKVNHNTFKHQAKQDLTNAIKVIQTTNDLKTAWKSITSKYHLKGTRVGQEVMAMLKKALSLSRHDR